MLLVFYGKDKTKAEDRMLPRAWNISTNNRTSELKKGTYTWFSVSNLLISIKITTGLHVTTNNCN